MIKAQNFFSILTALAMLTVFFGCAGNEEGTKGLRSNTSVESDTPKQGTFPELDWDTELQIKKDYIAFYSREHYMNLSDLDVNNLKIRGYFGNYNDCIPLFIDGLFSYAMAITSYVVAGYEFGFSSSHHIEVWKKGANGENATFHSLPDAYNLGFLTDEDIKNTQHRYTSGKDPMSWNPVWW